jgi:hypothetical protein
MPSVTLRAIGADSKEETLTEYLCDWPDCPNVAEHVLGVLTDIRVMSAVCPEHLALISKKRTQ